MVGRVSDGEKNMSLNPEKLYTTILIVIFIIGLAGIPSDIYKWRETIRKLAEKGILSWLFVIVATAGFIYLSQLPPKYEIHAWEQGNSQKQLIRVDEGICFLTMVTGKFEGGGERVRVYRSKDHWYLDGSSKQSGVAAEAQCLKF